MPTTIKNCPGGRKGSGFSICSVVFGLITLLLVFVVIPGLNASFNQARNGVMGPIGLYLLSFLLLTIAIIFGFITAVISFWRKEPKRFLSITGLLIPIVGFMSSLDDYWPYIPGHRILDQHALENTPLQDHEISRLRIGEYVDFEWIRHLSLSRNDRYIAGTYDNIIIVWDTVTSSEIQRFVGHTKNIRDVVFDPNGQFVISTSEDNTIRRWDVESGKEAWRFETITAGNTNLAISPTGDSVIFAFGSRIIILDTRTGKKVARTALPDAEVDSQYHRVYFSRDGKKIFAVDYDGLIHCWNAETLELIDPPIYPHPNEIERIAISDDGRHIVTGEQQNITFWDAASGKRLWSAQPFNAGNGWDIAISPDGKYVVHASQFIQLFNASTGKEIWRGTVNYPTNAIRFFHNGKFFVTGSDDSSVRIWEVPQDQSSKTKLQNNEHEGG